MKGVPLCIMLSVKRWQVQCFLRSISSARAFRLQQKWHPAPRERLILPAKSENSLLKMSAIPNRFCSRGRILCILTMAVSIPCSSGFFDKGTSPASAMVLFYFLGIALSFSATWMEDRWKGHMGGWSQAPTSTSFLISAALVGVLLFFVLFPVSLCACCPVRALSMFVHHKYVAALHFACPSEISYLQHTYYIVLL